MREKRTSIKWRTFSRIELYYNKYEPKKNTLLPLVEGMKIKLLIN